MTEANARCIAPAHGHYFHGFYNIQPWDASGRYFLCHRVGFIDRMPDGNDEAELGLIDLRSGEFLPLATTRAWNFQLGSLAHWLGGGMDGWIVFNSLEPEGFRSVVLNPATGRRRVADAPLFTVAHDGVTGLGYDFARLHPIRPGYAYAGVPYSLQGRSAPSDDGIRKVDLRTGQGRLLLSYADLADRFRIPEMQDAPVVVSRLLFNTDDTRFVMSLRFCQPQTGKWFTTLITTDPEGGRMHQLADFYCQVAHFDWAGPDRLLAWAHPKSSQPGFHLIRDLSGDSRPLGCDLMNVDGHCCYDPAGRWIVSDTFPGKSCVQKLLLYDAMSGNSKLLGEFPSDARYGGDIRCDLHPCWSRNGRSISFDHIEGGRRVIKVLDLPDSL